MSDLAEMPAEPLGDFLSALAKGRPAPGGGSAAAMAVTMAACLIRSVAQLSAERWSTAGGALAQAVAIERRVSPLIELDARRYEEARRALGDHSAGAAEGRDAQLGEALERAIEPPLQIGEAAADAAELAVLAVEHGEHSVRADALAAATLAEAAAAIAAALVEVNLATLASDPRTERARELHKRAAEARVRAGAVMAN